MALESATYIDDLNTANPAATDLVGQGDDHIRLIKAVLKATFPNITGPITLDQDEINGVLASLSGVGVPTGTICLWYGSSASIPAGWARCDGGTYAKVDLSGPIVAPDLRDSVAIGVGATIAPTQGAVVGAATASFSSGAAGAHTHATSGGGHSHTGVTIQGHALTIGEMPAHTHTYGLGGSGVLNGGGTGNASSNYNTSSSGGGAAHTHGITFPGTDGTHSHTVDAAADHTHTVSVPLIQPSVALHYILKL